jgi:hypothetical protein
MATDQAMKTCLKCKQEKSINEFRRDCRRKDGFKARCRSCLCDDSKDRHTKFCPRCKTEKPATEFGRDSNRKDGFRCWCRRCSTLETREDRRRNRPRRKATEQRYYQNNKAKYRVRGQEWARAHPDAMAGYSKAWTKRNPEKRKAIDAANDKKRDKKARVAWWREWRQQNSERLAAKQHARRKANPQAFSVWDRNKRLKRRLVKGTHTAADISDIRRLQRDRCAMPFCRVQLNGKGDVDHIRALARGGTNDRRNIQLLCQPCNNRKHA